MFSLWDDLYRGFGSYHAHISGRTGVDATSVGILLALVLLVAAVGSKVALRQLVRSVLGPVDIPQCRDDTVLRRRDTSLTVYSLRC